MSKLDEIRRDLRTIHQHQSESAAEQMADTLVDHVAYLLTEVDRLIGAGDLWEEERSELLNSREKWRERAESAERTRDEWKGMYDVAFASQQRVEALARRAGAGFAFPEEQIVTVSEIHAALGGEE